VLLRPRSNNENPLTVAGVRRVRDRIVVRNVCDASSNRSTFLVFILHTRCLFTFSLNRAKRWNFTGPERMIRSSFFFFGSHDDSLILVFWRRSWFLHSTFHRTRCRKCSQVRRLIVLFSHLCYSVVSPTDSRRRFSHRLKKRGNQTSRYRGRDRKCCTFATVNYFIQLFVP